MAVILERLSEIRQQISGEINNAADVDAVRAAITRVFEGFVIHPQHGARHSGTGRAELVDVDDRFMISFTIREEVLLSFAGMYPTVRRVPLALAGGKYRQGLPMRHLFGPIPVEG